MSVLLLTGAPGSPGVTTTALGLALAWPRGVVLADCDPSPAQAIIAGYLRGLDVAGRGLAGIAQLHRHAEELADHLPAQTVPLTDEPPLRRLLPGFTSPGAVRLFEHIWSDLGTALAGLDSQGIDALVDLGRLRLDGLPMGLVPIADQVLFVLRSDLPALAAARLYLPVVAQQLAEQPREIPLGLVLVGPARPYSAREISAQFGIPCLAQLPWEPKLSRYLSHGEDLDRPFSRSLLKVGYRTVAQRITETMKRRRLSREALLEGASRA